MDLEDGELSGSGSDTGGATAPKGGPGGPGGPSAAYRSTGPVPSSDSDQDSSEEEEGPAAWRRKRFKGSGAPTAGLTAPGGPWRGPAAPGGTFTASGGPWGGPAAPGGSSAAQLCKAPGGPPRRVNNIWGSVVQEQSQEAVAAQLCVFGVEGEAGGRDVENYNFSLARRMAAAAEQQEAPEGGAAAAQLDAELDAYMKGVPEREQEQRASARGDAKRKRPARERLGARPQMDPRGRRGLTEERPEEEVAEEIARRLQEPKKELILRAVKELGRSRALELLDETARLEQSGGVLTMDGSRRRTPGGVYLHLLKSSAGVSRAQARRIFSEEQQELVRSRREAQRRRRAVLARRMKEAIGALELQDEESRETFASDTNEALQSLEEAVEEEEQGEQEEERDEEQGEKGGEEEKEKEVGFGAEDSAVVYSSADLEVF